MASASQRTESICRDVFIDALFSHLCDAGPWPLEVMYCRQKIVFHFAAADADSASIDLLLFNP